MKKLVASRTLDAATWNASLIKGDAAVALRKLKEKSGGAIVTYGVTQLDRADFNMNILHDPFLLAIDSYRAAVLAKDVDAFVAIYDNDIHVFDMWSKWSLRGIDAWRKIATDWFSSLGTERVVVEARDTSAAISSDLVIGHAILTYTAFSSEGKELRSLSNRITMALRRTGDLWKVVHEHTSAPIDHHSAKAILKITADRAND